LPVEENEAAWAAYDVHTFLFGDGEGRRAPVRSPPRVKRGWPFLCLMQQHVEAGAHPNAAAKVVAAAYWRAIGSNSQPAAVQWLKRNQRDFVDGLESGLLRRSREKWLYDFAEQRERGREAGHRHRIRTPPPSPPRSWPKLAPWREHCRREADAEREEREREIAERRRKDPAFAAAMDENARFFAERAEREREREARAAEERRKLEPLFRRHRELDQERERKLPHPVRSQLEHERRAHDFDAWTRVGTKKATRRGSLYQDRG
jgi:hypothetical protein